MSRSNFLSRSSLSASPNDRKLHLSHHSQQHQQNDKARTGDTAVASSSSAAAVNTTATAALRLTSMYPQQKTRGVGLSRPTRKHLHSTSSTATSAAALKSSLPLPLPCSPTSASPSLTLAIPSPPLVATITTQSQTRAGASQKQLERERVKEETKQLDQEMNAVVADENEIPKAIPTMEKKLSQQDAVPLVPSIPQRIPSPPPLSAMVAVVPVPLPSTTFVSPSFHSQLPPPSSPDIIVQCTPQSQVEPSPSAPSQQQRQEYRSPVHAPVLVDDAKIADPIPVAPILRDYENDESHDSDPADDTPPLQPSDFPILTSVRPPHDDSIMIDATPSPVGKSAMKSTQKRSNLYDVDMVAVTPIAALATVVGEMKVEPHAMITQALPPPPFIPAPIPAIGEMKVESSEIKSEAAPHASTIPSTSSAAAAATSIPVEAAPVSSAASSIKPATPPRPSRRQRRAHLPMPVPETPGDFIFFGDTSTPPPPLTQQHHSTSGVKREAEVKKESVSSNLNYHHTMMKSEGKLDASQDVRPKTSASPHKSSAAALPLPLPLASDSDVFAFSQIDCGAVATTTMRLSEHEIYSIYSKDEPTQASSQFQLSRGSNESVQIVEQTTTTAMVPPQPSPQHARQTIITQLSPPSSKPEPTGITSSSSSAASASAVALRMPHMPDDSDMNTLDQSVVDCPGFVAPTMERVRLPGTVLYNNHGPQQTASATIASTSNALMAAAIAVASFPSTPASISSTSPRTPLSLCRSLQPIPPSPLTLHQVSPSRVSPPRHRTYMHPPPSDTIREKIRTYWQCTLGNDVSGISVGVLLEHALMTAAIEDGVEYEGYCTFLHIKLLQHPELVYRLQMREMTALELMALYPFSSLTQSHLKWDEIVVPPQERGVGIGSLKSKAKPATNVVPPSTAVNHSTSAAATANKVVTPTAASKVITPSSSTKTGPHTQQTKLNTKSSSKSSSASKAHTPSANMSILAFTSTSAPNVAQRLERDVLMASAAAAAQAEANTTYERFRPTVQEAYEAHLTLLQKSKQQAAATVSHQPTSVNTTPQQHQQQRRTLSPSVEPSVLQPSNLPSPIHCLQPRLRTPPQQPSHPPPPTTPTRRLFAELEAVSEEQQDQLSEQQQNYADELMRFDAIRRPPPARLPGLSDPPELERPPLINLYSEGQQNEVQPMEIDDARAEGKKMNDNTTIQVAAMGATSNSTTAPMITRSAASFMRTPHTATASSSIAAVTSAQPHPRIPYQLPPTPIVTISPLTSAPSSSRSSSTSANQTPSPGQRNGEMTLPHAAAAAAAASSARASGNVQSSIDMSVHKKRSYDGKEKRVKSKKAKSSTNDANNGSNAAAASTTTATSAQATLSAMSSYRQAKRKVAQKGGGWKRIGATDLQSGQWIITSEGERQYISRETGQTYSGSEAHEKAKADESALMRKRILKKRTAVEVDLTSASQEAPHAQKDATFSAQALNRPPPLNSLLHWGIPDAIVDAYRSLGVGSLYDWQVECLQRPGVLDGHTNLVYSAATSAGKTLIAEVLMLNRMIPGVQATIEEADTNSMAIYNKKVLFVLPYVSIVDEKTRDLNAKLSRLGFCIRSYHGQQSGQNDAGGVSPINLNSITPEIDIAVVVIEKAGMLWDNLRNENRLGEICAVVIDELHMISSEGGEMEWSQSTNAQQQQQGKSGYTGGNLANRGYPLELLLTKVVQYNRTHMNHASTSPSSTSTIPSHPLPIQIIGMSATLPNMDLFSSWLKPCQLYSTQFRPVPLKEYILWNKEVWMKVENHVANAQQQLAIGNDASLVSVQHTNRSVPTAAALPSLRYRFEKVRDVRPSEINKQVQQRSAALEQLSQMASRQPQQQHPQPVSKQDQQAQERHRAYVGMMLDLCDECGGGVLVFCPMKSEVENTAKSLAKGLKRRSQIRQSGCVVQKNATIQRTLDQMLVPQPQVSDGNHAAGTSSSSSSAATHAHERLLLLHRLASLNEGVDATLEKTVPHGVGYHHAGLTGDERLLIETAFRTGVLNILCCTSTLAAGVNLPARRVLFNGPRIGNRPLNITEYQQMSGRAGRTGQMDASLPSEGSSILIVNTKEEFENVKALLNQQLPPLKSSLDKEHRGLELYPAAVHATIHPSAAAAAASSSSSMLMPPPAQPVNLYFSHGLLDSIAALKSALQIPREDVESYLSHTLLAYQRAQEDRSRSAGRAATGNSSSSSSILSPSLSHDISLSLLYLSSHGLIDSRTNCATPLGIAICESGFNPYDGLRLHAELKYMRSKGICLSSTIHICWLLVPAIVVPTVSPPKIEEHRWELMKSRWSQMSSQDRLACRLLPIPASTHPSFKDTQIDDTRYHDHVICRNQSPHLTKPILLHADLRLRHAAYQRLYEALILQDCLNETKYLRTIQYETERKSGELHSLLKNACMLCNQLIILCEKLSWRDLSLLLENYRARFAHYGAPSELLTLLRIPDMKIRRARDLYTNGYTTIEEIVKKGSPQKLFDLFRKTQPYRAAVSSNVSTNSRGAAASSVASSTQSTRNTLKQEQAHTRVLMEQATQIYENARIWMQQEQEMKQKLYLAS